MPATPTLSRLTAAACALLIAAIAFLAGWLVKPCPTPPPSDDHGEKFRQTVEALRARLARPETLKLIAVRRNGRAGAVNPGVEIEFTAVGADGNRHRAHFWGDWFDSGAVGFSGPTNDGLPHDPHGLFRPAP